MAASSPQTGPCRLAPNVAVGSETKHSQSTPLDDPGLTPDVIRCAAPAAKYRRSRVCVAAGSCSTGSASRRPARAPVPAHRARTPAAALAQQQPSVGQTPGTDRRPTLAESVRRDQPWAGPVRDASMVRDPRFRVGRCRASPWMAGSVPVPRVAPRRAGGSATGRAGRRCPRAGWRDCRRS